MPSQYTSCLMMVRPGSFQFNEETAVSNAFQKALYGFTEDEIQQKAIAEFDQYVSKLREHGIEVIVIQDTPEPEKPDAIFPNNWISMQEDGTVYLYPMNTPNRRLERREEIIEALEVHFDIRHIIDLSDSENDAKFLEGTGSIIFDHINKIAYACISPRTDKQLFEAHCDQLGYEPVSFYSHDKNGSEVYHTNVMLTIGDKFAVICLESIRDIEERNHIQEKLESTGHEIIDITFEQMNQFAGNMLQVKNKHGKTFLVMSATAKNSLSEFQLNQIHKYNTILDVTIPTIETIGGGSARCMLAEIFLNPK